MIWVVSFLLSVSFGQDLKRRFEYEFSFKGPYIAQTDGQVPFWSYHDHAIAGDENVRLVPSLRSRQGSMWTKKVFDKDWWEIEVHIRISGRGKIGADGMAIWYTVEGPPGENGDKRIYGSRDRWLGLGILLDSFDNNNQQDNPYIMAFTNDGTKLYNHYQDGGGEELFGCRRDFRNKPYPVRLKIQYYKNVLSVFYHAGVTEFDDYELCGRQEGVVLEKGYFGLSAATGGLSDDHDVLKFLTHSISDPENAEEAQVETDEERLAREQAEEEYNKKAEIYKKEREEWEKENPQMANAGDLLGGDTDPQLQAIFKVQNDIQDRIKTISASIEQAKSMIDMLPQKLGPQQLGTAAPQPATGGIQNNPNAATKQDLQPILATQSRFTNDLNELKNYLRDITSKANAIQTALANQKPAAQQFEAIEDKQSRELTKGHINDIRNDLQILRRSVEFIQKDKGCPPPPEVSCVSPLTFVFLTMAQVALIGFIVHYKMSQEAAAKKFF